MKTSILAFLFLSLCSNLNSQTLGEAISKMDNERYAEALRSFKGLSEKSPNNGDIYYYWGLCYHKKGEQDSSLLTWKKGYDLDKTSALSHAGFFRVKWVMADKPAATIALTSALELTKGKKLVAKRAEVLRALASAYIESEIKDLDQALTLLTEAIEKDPNNEENYLLQGDALYAKTPQDASLAIKSYNKVLEIKPKSPRGKLRVANIYRAAQNFDLANSIYKEAVSIDSTFAPAYRERAELLMRFEKMNLAVKDWKKYLALNDNVESRYRFVSAMYIAGQYCEVIKEVEQLNQQGFRNFYTERFLAKSYGECKEITDGPRLGLEASDRFFALAPAEQINYIDYHTRGFLLVNMGKDSLGLLEMEKAINLSQEALKDLTIEMVKLYYKTKKYDAAISTYQKREKVIALTANEILNYGQCYFFGPKNFVLADSLFAKLNQMAPTYANGFYWRARSSFQLDLNNEKWSAKEPYAKILELIPAEKRAEGSNKKMVIEAAKFMGNYYAVSQEKDPNKTKEYFKIVYDIDPKDEQAKQVLGIK